jgi:hypothetical protein
MTTHGKPRCACVPGHPCRFHYGLAMRGELNGRTIPYAYNFKRKSKYSKYWVRDMSVNRYTDVYHSWQKNNSWQNA